MPKCFSTRASSLNLFRKNRERTLRASNVENKIPPTYGVCHKHILHLAFVTLNTFSASGLSRLIKTNTVEGRRCPDERKRILWTTRGVKRPRKITLPNESLFVIGICKANSKSQNPHGIRAESLTQAALSISLVVKLGEGSSNCGKRPSLLQFLGARLPQ